MSLKSIKSLVLAGIISMAFTAPALADTAIKIVVNTPIVKHSAPVKIKNSHRHVVFRGQHTHVKNVVIIPAQTIPAQTIVVTKVVPQKSSVKKKVIRNNKPVTYSPKEYTHQAVYHH